MVDFLRGSLSNMDINLIINRVYYVLIGSPLESVNRQAISAIPELTTYCDSIIDTYSELNTELHVLNIHYLNAYTYLDNANVEDEWATALAKVLAHFEPEHPPFKSEENIPVVIWEPSVTECLDRWALSMRRFGISDSAVFYYFVLSDPWRAVIELYEKKALGIRHALYVWANYVKRALAYAGSEHFFVVKDVFLDDCLKGSNVGKAAISNGAEITKYLNLLPKAWQALLCVLLGTKEPVLDELTEILSQGLNGGTET